MYLSRLQQLIFGATLTPRCTWVSAITMAHNPVKILIIGIAVLTSLSLQSSGTESTPPSKVPIPLGFSSQPVPAISTNPIPAEAGQLPFSFTGPGSRDFALTASARTWFGLGTLEWTLALPDTAPTNAQVLVFMKDWDYLWYQQLLPGHPTPGITNPYRTDLSPSAANWEPCGHHAAWNARALMEPREFGIRVFFDGTNIISGTLANASATPLPIDTAPPAIRDVRPASQQVACYEKFEVIFALPDRYANPFDPDEISVTANVQTPDGKTVTIAGFHSRAYYRTVSPTGEEIIPQGPPHWKIRYAPTQPGTHLYTLKATDAQGTAIWGPGVFNATPPKTPGFIRVSPAARRYFEFDNGDYYFPIGHNIRSPSDSRLNDQFPWSKRWIEGTAAYARHFPAMRKHGENLAEIWMAAWSLGIEWSPQWRGYHGLGQYNLMNAWELDQVIDEADRNGLYLNLVIHNHGKFSTIIDNEWVNNPFNQNLGGYLGNPEEFFTDPRARKDFLKLMRYIIARWGYSTRVFAWELWSELNITGASGVFYRSEACVDWHRFATAAIRELDPNDHLITTHYCPDYTSQNMNITTLPGITHASMDAYHKDDRVLRIVDLLQATAKFNNPAGKPALITEFGGAATAQGLTHLQNSLHAALWASTCIPLAGTPLFWWWGLIEEEDYYPEFLAISRFMKDIDRRDPTLLPHTPKLSLPGTKENRIMALSLKSPTRTLGWIYDTPAFNTAPSEPHPAISNLVTRLDGMNNGRYRVEFWETTRGTLAKSQDVEVTEGLLSFTVPLFTRDIAFKAWKR